MIARALGFRSKHDLPAARAELGRAHSILLGPQAPLLRALDIESVVRLVNSSRKLAMLARLTAVDAGLAADTGNGVLERQLMERARKLAESAVKLNPADDEAIAVQAELRAQ
jgi:hypothetical protein